MRAIKKGRAAVVALIVSAIAVFGTALPAYAWPTTKFSVCGPYLCSGITQGTFTWYNRTAYVDGTEWISLNYDCVTSYFESYAGATKVNARSWKACWEGSGTATNFEFTIGDTNLVGGIDRIKVTVCSTRLDDPDRDCGTPKNYYKP